MGSSIQQFLCPGLTTADCYKNHVWIWTSSNKGKTWQLRDESLAYTGFSDPDLTQDASGSVYNTGIDLVNDSVFSSQDGGKTWPHGTPQCHAGDRPWLAGGKAGEVFVAINTEENGSQPPISSRRENHDAISRSEHDDRENGATRGLPRFSP